MQAYIIKYREFLTIPTYQYYNILSIQRILNYHHYNTLRCISHVLYNYVARQTIKMSHLLVGRYYR